ncbi:MAG: dihydroorotate dehydrogenase electron transfer subunit [Myxococcales bacterium]|nr:dihydroorotate dehydrogenase electron transfer subunit [Myxococcales bacterium]
MQNEGRYFSAPLVRREELGAGYFVLAFALEHALVAEPGQFLMMRGAGWGSSPLLPRPMSVLDAGDDLTVLIKVVGEGTGRMATCPLGERYDLLAPLGKPFQLPPLTHTPVLVAGGVGVAPLVSLAERLAARSREGASTAPNAHGLYGGRTAADLPLAQRLAASVELEVTTEDGSQGERGRVTLVVERTLDRCRTEGRPVTVFTCGPHRMMAAVVELAARYGADCQTSLEAPMGCGYGVCLGCPVARKSGGYLYACVDGPCVDASVVDWQRDVFA